MLSAPDAARAQALARLCDRSCGLFSMLRAAPAASKQARREAHIVVQSDPGEMRNLFDTDDASDVRKQLMEYIDRRPDDIKPNSVQVGRARSLAKVCPGARATRHSPTERRWRSQQTI